MGTALGVFGNGGMTFDALVEEYIAHHCALHPIDATFAGIDGYDDKLPPVHATVEAEERAALIDLQQRLQKAVPNTAGERIDARMMQAQIALALDALAARSRFANPSWATGEAAFGLISLMLPSAPPDAARAFASRLEQVPDFLAGAAKKLQNAPADWTTRARNEAAALTRLLRNGLSKHPFAATIDRNACEDACAALERYDRAIAALPDADPACGRERLAVLMRTMHGLPDTPAQLEARAVEAYERVSQELNEEAKQLDPSSTWREQLSRLSAITPEGANTEAYEYWHERAIETADDLVTPAIAPQLRFLPLPEWASEVAGDLYFLYYRSPAPMRRNGTSVYWVAAGKQSLAAIKTVHAAHHGSIGHHTQNARARVATSRIAKIAGTDCASGLMFYTAGTMVEGWACYAEDVLAEVPDFYTGAERLQLKYFELRNIACCIADIRLHTGAWNLEEMRAFYRDEVGFAPERIWSETTRNSIYPATRLMYWCGTEQIASLRRRASLPAKAFHDRFLSYGAMPVAWIAEEFQS